MAYRWQQASGGEIPAEAYVKGHGYGVEDGELHGRALWVARTPPDDNGAVRLSYVERGQSARFGDDRVDVYEVLLDRGTWNPEDRDGNPPSGRAVCGHDAQGTVLYAATSDEEEWGFWPRQADDGSSSSWSLWYLLEPADPEPPTYPWEDRYDDDALEQQEDDLEAAAAATSAAEAASVVVSALDLRNEVVVISNTGTDPVNLWSWRLRDTSRPSARVGVRSRKVASAKSH
jgi:hypothetical protein